MASNGVQASQKVTDESSFQLAENNSYSDLSQVLHILHIVSAEPVLNKVTLPRGYTAKYKYMCSLIKSDQGSEATNHVFKSKET
jgi:hypothetical protein